MYEISFNAGAAKAVRKLPAVVRSRVLAALERLAVEPRPHGSAKLVDRPTAWRIRVGDYRVIYDIFDDELVVSVVRVGHRRDVYRH